MYIAFYMYKKDHMGHVSLLRSTLRLPNSKNVLRFLSL